MSICCSDRAESGKDLGVFLDHLLEMDYESLTAEHAPVAGPSQVTSDALLWSARDSALFLAPTISKQESLVLVVIVIPPVTGYIINI